MDLNVVAVFNGHQAAAKIMTEAGHGGTITTTSSMVAKYGQPLASATPRLSLPSTAWSSRSRASSPHGIRVNAVAPGVTKTDMVANLPEEVIKPIIATIPLGRMGEPEDVATPSFSLRATCPPMSRAPSSPSTGSPLLKVESFGFEPQQSSTQKARCPHQPQAARLLLFGRNPYPDTPCYLPSSSWASSRA